METIDVVGPHALVVLSPVFYDRGREAKLTGRYVTGQRFTAVFYSDRGVQVTIRTSDAEPAPVFGFDEYSESSSDLQAAALAAWTSFYEGERESQDRLCKECGMDILGNDPHAEWCKIGAAADLHDPHPVPA